VSAECGLRVLTADEHVTGDGRSVVQRSVGRRSRGTRSLPATQQRSTASRRDQQPHLSHRRQAACRWTQEKRTT